MKRIALLFGMLWLAANTLTAQEIPASYAFDRTTHDYGKLKSNQTGTAVFKLTNRGSAPLILLDVKVTCNCVKIDWPRQPIPPGQSADLTVTYKDRESGAFYKVVEVVTTGTPEVAKITLKGSIE